MNARLLSSDIKRPSKAQAPDKQNMKRRVAEKSPRVSSTESKTGKKPVARKGSDSLLKSSLRAAKAMDQPRGKGGKSRKGSPSHET